MAPQVGLESTRKPKFNNMQGHGWHRKSSESSARTTNGSQMDRCERAREAARLAVSRGVLISIVSMSLNDTHTPRLMEKKATVTLSLSKSNAGFFAVVSPPVPLRPLCTD
jgi:hypothetical protein